MATAVVVARVVVAFAELVAGSGATSEGLKVVVEVPLPSVELGAPGLADMVVVAVTVVVVVVRVV